MMNKIPNSSNMVFKLFRERQCFSYQSRNALPKRIVESFNVIGFASFFTNGQMACGRKDGRIGLPKIGITQGVLTIVKWERVP